ncbi:MAG TPA: hypothetical protein VG649_24285 [Candidatus Angelobacter sp.]|jgi:hypothetical protein|nr:hypothetical protein [Candidatus Angelobacter sp.]
MKNRARITMASAATIVLAVATVLIVRVFAGPPTEVKQAAGVFLGTLVLDCGRYSYADLSGYRYRFKYFQHDETSVSLDRDDRAQEIQWKYLIRTSASSVEWYGGKAWKKAQNPFQNYMEYVFKRTDGTIGAGPITSFINVMDVSKMKPLPQSKCSEQPE